MTTVKIPFEHDWEFYRVTHEWALQILLETWLANDRPVDQIDFGTIKVWTVPDSFESGIAVRVAVPPTIHYTLQDFSTFMRDWWNETNELDYEEITLEAVADPINNELTRIGYGPKTNTIALGKTRQWKVKVGFGP